MHGKYSKVHMEFLKKKNKFRVFALPEIDIDFNVINLSEFSIGAGLEK